MIGFGQTKNHSSTKEGVPEGFLFYFHENGQLKEESNYVNGLEHGLCKSYHENGQLSFEKTYKNSELLDSKCWNLDGNKIECE